MGLTISLAEAQRIETQAAPIREAARQLIEEYVQRRNGTSPEKAEVVDAERVE